MAVMTEQEREEEREAANLSDEHIAYIEMMKNFGDLDYQGQ